MGGGKMSMIYLKCPSCGCDVYFDESKSNYYCKNCGTLLWHDGKQVSEAGGVQTKGDSVPLQQNAGTTMTNGNDVPPPFFNAEQKNAFSNNQNENQQAQFSSDVPPPFHIQPTPEKKGNHKILAIVLAAVAACIFLVMLLAPRLGNNKYIDYVKNGSPKSYPNITYGKAFGSFFANPTWKYFKSDENQDVVEFSGACSYQNVNVTARVQFLLDVDNGTFDVYYLGFNDVPQNKLIIMGLIKKVFESYGGG
jgi:hypothetical protein